jgi:hypothetical protein
MATSGTYSFISTVGQQLIDEAYERAGVLPDVITAQKIQTAQRSGNLVLSEWINKGYNLWTSTQSLLNLLENQASYDLSNLVYPKSYPLSDVIDVNIRTFQRPLDGTATSSDAGNASSLFNATDPGNFTQNAANGWISYDYGANQQNEVTMVGISSLIARSYTLVFEYSSDNVTWGVAKYGTAFVFVAPDNVTLTNTRNTTWISMDNPLSARYFRIRETGGAILSLEQIFFCTEINDIVMARISGSEYMSYPNKTLASKPSVYWLDRQTTPKLTVWPVPTNEYTVISFRAIRMLQDVGNMTDSIEIPARFYDAYCADLAARLAMKQPQVDFVRVDKLKEEAKEAYSYAATEDVEKVPLRLIPSYLTGWSRL